MDAMLKELLNFGAVGIVAALALYLWHDATSKYAALVADFKEVIQGNTAALVELRTGLKTICPYLTEERRNHEQTPR